MTDHRTDTKKSHDRAKHGAKRETRHTANAIDANPLAIVVGGAALGAIAGALIPRSKREKELLAPLGHQLNARARNAFAAAREAGSQELNELGISKGAARTQARSLVDGIGQALSNAGQAAAKSAAAKPD